ncbi:MAG: J domain-containing protein [Bdellovibrionales bacterium]|nr:J domain-containing protein [Bdellovibrionales bacterium]
MSDEKEALVNYYLVLNVSSSATQEEIKKAFLSLAKIYHPDKNRGNRLSEKKFQQLNSAWEVLRDPKKRRSFDIKLKKKEGFKKLFLNPSPFLDSRVQIEKGIDLEVCVKVSLEEVCQSLQKKICYFKPINGKKKKSSFSFQIPVGTKEKTRLMFKGEGGTEGLGEFGDLYVKIIFHPHSLFKLLDNAYDLILEQPISVVSAFQDKELKTLSPYSTLKLQVKPPLLDKQMLQVKGLGLYKNLKGEKGDLFIKILIDYPLDSRLDIKEVMKNLSLKEKKQYIEELSKNSFLYPKVLKFQKQVQKLKVQYHSL